MPARSMWNGTLRCGAAALRVKLHAAVSDKTVHFHLLHDRDKARVRQKLVVPGGHAEIPEGEIRRGYEIEPGVFVVLEEEELQELAPQGGKDIEIMRFVPLRTDRYPWYERPYYLSPDGDAGAYFALAEALRATKREGIARWVMRKQHYVGALREEQGYLLLVSLRHAGEVIDASALPTPGGAPLSAKELEMAEQLVSMLEEDFDPEAFKDEYRARLEALIEAKSHGKLYKFERPVRRKQPESLERALTASLARAKKERRSA